MDWNPIRAAVRQVISTCSGVPVQEVQGETERGGFAGISTGRRIRTDFGEREIGEDYVVELVTEAGELEPAVIGMREVVVDVRVFSDDHRDYSWAHSITSSIATRIALPQMRAILEATGLAFYRFEDIIPSPPQDIDKREQSVSSLRLIFGLAICEHAGDVPGVAPDTETVDHFEHVELTTKALDEAGQEIVQGPEIIPALPEPEDPEDPEDPEPEGP